MKSEIRSLIEPLLCLCTVHLTKRTCDTITYEERVVGWPIWYGNEYGAFVHVSPYWRDYEDAPEDLMRCIEFAHKEGIAWIKFDPDGNVVDDLPTYNETWE